jgi:hypothetical protein
MSLPKYVVAAYYFSDEGYSLNGPYVTPEDADRANTFYCKNYLNGQELTESEAKEVAEMNLRRHDLMQQLELVHTIY